MTGGTGLYLRALIEGLFAGPERSEPLRDRLRGLTTKHGAGALHRVLLRFDPESAALIHPNDEPKLIRAIEVSMTAGKPMSVAWQQGRERLEGFRILRIGLEPERKALYARINQRAEEMFRDGLVAETERLIATYGEVLPPAGFAGIQAGEGSPERDSNRRRGGGLCSAGPSQLRQAPTDLVSPRAGGSLAPRLWE